MQPVSNKEADKNIMKYLTNIINLTLKKDFIKHLHF